MKVSESLLRESLGSIIPEDDEQSVNRSGQQLRDRAQEILNSLFGSDAPQLSVNFFPELGENTTVPKICAAVIEEFRKAGHEILE
jgi:hypothetical protein